MVAEQIQNYVNLVGGVTRATKAKASEAAKGLLSAAGLDDVAADANERVTNLAEEIIAASRANRQLLVKMISAEVDKAAAKIGFARAEDVAALRGEVAELKAGLAEQSARAERAEAAAAEATAAAATAAAAAVAATEATAPAARKTSATKAPAKKAPAKKATASRTTPAKKAPAKKAPAKKATASRTTPAKRAATKKPATKKSAATTEAATTEAAVAETS